MRKKTNKITHEGGADGHPIDDAADRPADAADTDCPADRPVDAAGRPADAAGFRPSFIYCIFYSGCSMVTC